MPSVQSRLPEKKEGKDECLNTKHHRHKQNHDDRANSVLLLVAIFSILLLAWEAGSKRIAGWDCGIGSVRLFSFSRLFHLLLLSLLFFRSNERLTYA